jgi:hypothetical protein
MIQTKIFNVLFSIIGFTLAYFFRDLITVILFITGIGFTIIPAAISSFHFKILPKAALASFISGIVYIFVLIITGNLIPELSIASIIIATFFLILFQLILKNKK